MLAIDRAWALKPLHGDPRFAAITTRCRAEINQQRQIGGLPPAELK